MKNLVITFSSAPHGSARFSEGLRLASGMGFNDHKAKLIFMGEGVLCALKGVEKDISKQFLELISEFQYPLFVEQESLEKNGIKEADIDPVFKIISREDAAKMITDSDLQFGM